MMQYEGISKDAVGKSGISLALIAACLLLSPAAFKAVGGILFGTGDTAEWVEGLK